MEELKLHKSLALLQGVLRDAKTQATTFKSASENVQYDLFRYVNEEPTTLLELGQIFLSSCPTFSNGGDYNETEITLERAALNKIDSVVLQSVKRRGLRLKNMLEIEKRAWSCFSDFQKVYKTCLRNLSVKEGLGRKFGAPRRRTQGKVKK